MVENVFAKARPITDAQLAELQRAANLRGTVRIGPDLDSILARLRAAEAVCEDIELLSASEVDNITREKLAAWNLAAGRRKTN